MEEQNITCITRDKINKRKQAMARTDLCVFGIAVAVAVVV